MGDPYPLGNFTADSKAMTHSSSSTIVKAKNDAESKAMYQGFVTAKAHATSKFCGGTATISNSKVKINVNNVRYINE